MKHLFQQRFEDDFQRVASALSKKGGTRKYDKVLQRIGRLKEKYALIAQYYEIHVHHTEQIATALEWKFAKPEKAEQRFSGTYFLRTTRTDLNEKEIWSLIIMLTHVEDAFRCFKSELNLRPIYHQKEDRSAHVRTTTLMTTRDQRRIHIRKSSEPEPFHRLIYDALDLSYYPIKMKRVEL